MTTKILDKKKVKISFTESSEENEEHSFHSWRCDHFNGETFQKNKSQVLWSRESFFAAEEDFCFENCDNFSDLTGETVSSCSWHNDEFDLKTASEVNASLQAIDDALYEKKKSSFMREDIFQECCDWCDKFPYLRLIGQPIQRPFENSVFMGSSSSKHPNLYHGESLSECLQVEGKRLTMRVSGRVPKQISFDNDPVTSERVLNYFEEAGDLGNKHEEILAVDDSELSGEVMGSIISTDEITAISSTIKSLQEKIIDRLSLEMWPNVLKMLQKHVDRVKNSKNEEFQLPPISLPMEKSFCSKRPKTEGTGLSVTEFPKLSCILSVSPKVLQKKSFETGNSTRMARPTSEMSLTSRNYAFSDFNRNDTFKVAKPINLHSMNGQSKLSSDKKEEKCAEHMCLFLPTLEEDISDPSAVLRGFHIEPEIRDFSSKSVISTNNNYEASSTSKKYNCFLPPIDSRSLLPTNVKLTRNLFTFYGSQIKNDKSEFAGPVIYKPSIVNSRPGTSTSKKIVKSQGNVQQKSLNDGHNKPENSSSVDPENEDVSQERSVALFPLVKSLVPYKEKNYTCVKKGLLHAFVGRKR